MAQELFEKFDFQSRYLNDVEYKLKRCWILNLEMIGKVSLVVRCSQI